jgi:hypothetical protein
MNNFANTFDRGVHTHHHITIGKVLLAEVDVADSGSKLGQGHGLPYTGRHQPWTPVPSVHVRGFPHERAFLEPNQVQREPFAPEVSAPALLSHQHRRREFHFQSIGTGSQTPIEVYFQRDEHVVMRRHQFAIQADLADRIQSFEAETAVW